MKKLRGSFAAFSISTSPPPTHTHTLCSTFLPLFVFACNASRLDREDLLLFTTCNIATQWPLLTWQWDSSLGHYLSREHTDTEGRGDKKRDNNVNGREIKWFILFPKHNILLQEARRQCRSSARHIARWTRTIDHRRRLLLAVCCLPDRLPFILFMSASPILSSPSFCLSQAPHFSSPSICQPSPHPLLFLPSSL